MKKIFKISDTPGSEFMLGFAHMLDIGDHAAYCMLLKQLAPLSAHRCSETFWRKLNESVRQFTSSNKDCVVYFCHYDTVRNLARLRLYLSKASEICTQEELSNIFVFKGKDMNGRSRHLFVYINSLNKDKDELLETIKKETDTFVRLHTECQIENDYLGF